MLITPAQVQLHFEVLSSASWLAICTVGARGNPRGGRYRDAGLRREHTKRRGGGTLMTCGFEGLMHMPNGLMFTFGT